MTSGRRVNESRAIPIQCPVSRGHRALEFLHFTGWIKVGKFVLTFINTDIYVCPVHVHAFPLRGRRNGVLPCLPGLSAARHAAFCV